MALSSSAVTASASDFPLQAPDLDESDYLPDASPWQASRGGQSPYNFEDQSHDCSSNYEVHSSYQSNGQSMFSYGSQLRGPDQQQLTGGYQYPPYNAYDADPNCPRSCYSGIDPAAYQMSMSKQQDSCPPDHYFADGMMHPEDSSGYSHGLGLPHGHGLMHDGYQPMHYDSFSDSMDPSDNYDYFQAYGEERSASEPVQGDANPEKEPPYAKLIYEALMKAPNKTMVLRDIYAWFRENTDKATDKETKGWQNSIRHNLSMNGAFKKVEQPAGEDSKKGNMWMLTEEAIREGVKSTTRYRAKQPKPRGSKVTQATSGKSGHHSTAARNKAVRQQQQQRQQQRRPECGSGIFDNSGLPADQHQYQQHHCLPLGEGYDVAAGEIDYSAGLAADQDSKMQAQAPLLHNYARYHHGFEVGPPSGDGRFFARGRLPPAPTSAGTMAPYHHTHVAHRARSSPEADDQFFYDSFSSTTAPVGMPFSSPESDDGPTTPPSSDLDLVSIHDQDIDMRSLLAGSFYETGSRL